jgi:hypothetical protein
MDRQRKETKMSKYSVRISDGNNDETINIQAETPEQAERLAREKAEQWLETGDWDTSNGPLYLHARWSLYQRKFAALDADGELIGLYDSRDGAAGACQDAAREADSAGDECEVEQRDDEIAEGSAAVTVQPTETA